MAHILPQELVKWNVLRPDSMARGDWRESFCGLRQVSAKATRLRPVQSTGWQGAIMCPCLRKIPGGGENNRANEYPRESISDNAADNANQGDQHGCRQPARQNEGLQKIFHDNYDRHASCEGHSGSRRQREPAPHNERSHNDQRADLNDAENQDRKCQ